MGRGAGAVADAGVLARPMSTVLLFLSVTQPPPLERPVCDGQGGLYKDEQNSTQSRTPSVFVIWEVERQM